MVALKKKVKLGLTLPRATTLTRPKNTTKTIINVLSLLMNISFNVAAHTGVSMCITHTHTHTHSIIPRQALWEPALAGQQIN